MSLFQYQPTQQCSQVPKEECRQVPRPSAKEVRFRNVPPISVTMFCSPQVCVPVAVSKPRQECRQVPRQECDILETSQVQHLSSVTSSLGKEN